MNTAPQTLSVVFITHNPGERFVRALESVQWANEVIVVDQGSTDGTLALARRYTDGVYFNPSADPWVIKQEAIALAQCDWILCMEPEEWIEEALRHEIEEILQFGTNQCEGYELSRKLWFWGRGLSGETAFTPQALRLFRRFKGTVMDAPTGPQISVAGSTRLLKQPLWTEPFQTLDELMARLMHQGKQQAYQALESAQPEPNLFKLLGSPLGTFTNRYFGNPAGIPGLIIAIAEAYQRFFIQAHYYALLHAHRGFGADPAVSP